MNLLRVTAGLVLVLMLVVWTISDVRKWLTIRQNLAEGFKTDIDWFEENCAKVRDQLPERGRVGFRDLRPREDFPDRRHALVQYALVPLYVEWQTSRTPTVVVLPNRVRVDQTGGP